MSVEDLHAFFTRLEGDEGLRQEVIALDADSDEERLAALCTLAAREGFVVAGEDWEHDSVGPAVAALEDEELRSVVGGAGCPPWAWIGARSAGAYGENGCGESVGLAGGGCGGSLGAAGGSGCG